MKKLEFVKGTPGKLKIPIYPHKKTKRNKLLEPILTGAGVIGYNKEIHDEDSVVFSYKLPLGAIKRLIRSYYKDINDIDAFWVYYRSTGSDEIRKQPYCYRMIGELQKQLDKHGLKGRTIIDEVFNKYFKEDYERLERFEKNHGDNVMESFKPCNDPECCKPSDELNQGGGEKSNE